MSHPTKPVITLASPFIKHLDPEVLRLDGGVCILRLEPRAEFGNSKGDLHGGIIASLLDISMAQAVRTTQEVGIKVSTITLTTNYLAPSRGTATATARVVRAGASICYAECEILNEKDEIVAHASGTFRIIRSHLRDGAHKAKES